MAAKTLTVGLVILFVGLVLGVAGIAYPATGSSTQTYSVLPSSTFKVDPNDYQSHNIVLKGGNMVNYGLSLSKNTTGVFDLLVMNQGQYYVYYGCAPACHQPLLGGTGNYSQQGGEKVAYLLNKSVTPANPVSGTFTSPSNGTYYFIFDNSVGNNWTSFVSSGGTSGNPAWVTFSLLGSRPITTYSTDWLLVGPGAVLLIVGGAIGSIGGSRKPAS